MKIAFGCIVEGQPKLYENISQKVGGGLQPKSCFCFVFLWKSSETTREMTMKRRKDKPTLTPRRDSELKVRTDGLRVVNSLPSCFTLPTRLTIIHVLNLF